MNKEDKELLLKDLCARLPYGVCVKHRTGIFKFDKNHQDIGVFYKEDGDFHIALCGIYYGDDIKPYLRPLSNMTKVEAKEYLNDTPYLQYIRVDWLNAHHFDYRGLIEKGLAIEAPVDMYKFD